MALDDNTYTEQIKIVPVLDEKEAEKVEKELKKLKSGAKMEMFNSGLGKVSGFMNNNVFKNLATSNNLFVSTIGDFGEEMADLFNGQGSVVGKLFTKLVSSLTTLFSHGMEELQDMIGYSRLSNAHTRELAFSYGFSGSQVYGFDKAMAALGFTSEEDLMYAAAEGGYQIKKFNELFQKYTAAYESNYDEETLNQMEEFNVEMAEFKEDINQTIVAFIVDNKELLKSAMQAVVDTANFILHPFDTRSTAREVSAAKSYTAISRSSNVSINNTFNTSTEVARQEYTNAGMMTLEQTLRAVEAI